MITSTNNQTQLIWNVSTFNSNCQIIAIKHGYHHQPLNIISMEREYILQ